jgi:ketosteroid isomerase-like protein
MMTSSVDSTVAAELTKLEQERCRALSEKDWPALEALLSEDYTHVHTTGRVEDRPTYLQGMKERPRETSRGPLSVRVYGDSAVMMGSQTNKTQGHDGTSLMHSAVIQVWVKQGSGWKLVAAQNTRVAQQDG